MKNKYDVSVVVCAKNEETHIGECLARIRNQTYPCELVVVDGHSKDKTVEISKRYGANVVHDNGKGISDARNVGWKAARGKIVAYCDADCKPTLDWVEKIVRAMPRNIGVSGPITPYDCHGDVAFDLDLWTRWMFRLFARLGHPCIIGPNMAFLRKVLEKEPFKTPIIEDYEIGRRLVRLGHIAFVPDMIMFVSGRRFKCGFYRNAMKHYVLNVQRLWARKPIIREGYWK